MKKITINFKDLFDIYSISDKSNDVHELSKKIFVKDPSGKLVPVRGIIKKTDVDMCKFTTENNISRKMAYGHLLKCTTGFKQLKDIDNNDDIYIYNNQSTKIKSIEPCNDIDVAYDISLDAPHEYVTPDNLIHHNTTIARIIVDALIQNDSDVLVMNGSDNTGVESMRTTVAGFLKSPPYQAKLKIVYIDEFDYTTQNAQAVLRNMMEAYSSTGRFIITGNYWSKVMEPIQSRFTLYEMKTLPKEFVIEYAKNILTKEKVEFDEQSVELIVTSLLPDVRKVVNTLQKNTINKKLKKIDVNTIISNEKKISGLLVQIGEQMGSASEKATINRNIPQITELLNTGSEPDYLHIYQTLFFHPELPAWAKIKVNEYSNKHNSCVNPVSHFMAMVYDVVQSGMTFFNLFGKK